MSRVMILLLALTTIIGNASAQSSSGIYVVPDPVPFHLSPDDALYCQTPGDIGLNASSGYGSELADDIPAALAGEEFNTVTLWVAEWLAPWTDPDGVTITLYDAACPPDQVAAQQFYFPWDELAPMFFADFGVMVVYEVVAHLPSTITVTNSMSIGGYVDNDWGTSQPFCGFFGTRTNPMDILGCQGIYADNLPEGFPRWTHYSIGADWVDLGYCLAFEPTTSVSETETSLADAPVLSWSQPNPFRARTLVHFEAPSTGAASLAVFDGVGRRVRQVSHRVIQPGLRSIPWDGRDDRGARVPSGTYFYRLEMGDWMDSGQVVVFR